MEICSKIKTVMMDRKLRKQVGRFLIAGFSAVGTDSLVYYLLLNKALLSHTPSKALSFFSGTIVAFLINKFFTFEVKKKSFTEIIRFLILYVLTMFANVGVNKLVLLTSQRFEFIGSLVNLIFISHTLFAFLCATGTSTVLNFLGMKFWVFKEETEVQSEE